MAVVQKLHQSRFVLRCLYFDLHHRQSRRREPSLYLAVVQRLGCLSDQLSTPLQQLRVGLPV